MLLQAMSFQLGDDGLGVADGPQVLDDDLAVGHDEDDGREAFDVILVDNSGATIWSRNGGILDAVVVHPIEAGRLSVSIATKVNFHIIDIVHVAAHGGVGLDYFRSGILARAASGVEEVDQYRLTAVKDVEQVDVGAMNVGSREVDGLGEGGLRFQAKAKNQREHKGKEFFHVVMFLMVNNLAQR